MLCTVQPSLFKQSWQASRPCLWGIHLAICESLQISLKEASKSYYRLTFNFFCIAILISHIFSFRFRFHFLTFVYFLNAKKIACKVVKCRTWVLIIDNDWLRFHHRLTFSTQAKYMPRSCIDTYFISFCGIIGKK